uniref:zinc finger CW-type PWWP domain protein 1 isoform X1 n=1 Tax=Jaculus jaculus TaxID=51337 RepID=UPI001E1AF536|nr:zinc finger CW-type PWWP domain protein 1 isoform X1 [Jaculus jaculus]
MMAALQNNEEYEKVPKKTFAPPTQKWHSIMPPGPNSYKEDTLGISSPQAEANPNPPKASLKRKEQKAATQNGLSRGQEKKQKVQDKTPSEKHRKGKATLSNAEFEEIVQTVLQKTLQECLGMGTDLNFAETSYFQRIVCIQSDREPGIVASGSDNDNTDGERVMAPDNTEIPACLEDKVDLDIQTSELGQVAPALAKKKFNRPNLSKRKKEAQDESMEEMQDRHVLKQKDQQRTMTKDRSQIRGQQNKEESGFGQCIVWVQCSYPTCEKWRRLHRNIDPSVLPDNWSCDQNPDLDYNRCDIPEETWIGCESDVVYASYVPGSIIWAKQYGYPWWPGMVESDPDLGEYFLFASHLDSLPSKYHVTFFGETACRAWIPVNMLKNFQELSQELATMKKCKNKDYSQKLEAAIMMAQKAEQTNIQERVNLFGFRSRYNAPENNGEGKDLPLSGPNSPESCLEKEEEDLELEKEEKRDPTLHGPKPAKVQTKRTKPRGMTDGQGRTLKRKTMEKCLGSESTPYPAPMVGEKGGQKNSDLDCPGPKKKFKAPEMKASVCSASEEKEDRMVPEDLTLAAHHGLSPLVEKEGPSFRKEPPSPEALHFPSEYEASTDLDLEQFMEDIGREESERRQDPQHREDSEDFLAAFFE